MRARIYQVWLDRRTGRYYGARLEAGKITGMTEGFSAAPPAARLPGLVYGPVVEPVPKLSNPRWRLLRLVLH